MRDNMTRDTTMTDENDDDQREAAHRLADVLQTVAARAHAEYGLGIGAIGNGAARLGARHGPQCRLFRAFKTRSRGTLNFGR